MMWNKYDLYVVMEFKDGAVFKTRKVGHVWLSPEESIALRGAPMGTGPLQLHPSKDAEDTKYGKARPA